MSAKATLERPALTPVIVGPGRPDAYLTESGLRVPSVTTITGRFKSADALIAWSYRNGYGDGEAKKPCDPNAARDAAADAGHITHDWIRDTIAERPLTPFPYSPEPALEHAKRSLEAFITWADEVELRVVAVEVPLVHEDMHFGGTWDGVGFVKGELRILDWKSGNRTYPEHLVQVAAYRELLRHARIRAGSAGPWLVPEGAALVRLDKETGTPHARLFDADALDLGWDYFAKLRHLYELEKDVTKTVADRKPKRGKKAA